MKQTSTYKFKFRSNINAPNKLNLNRTFFLGFSRFIFIIWIGCGFSTFAIAADRLMPGESLYQGQSLTSLSGNHHLMMQSDGNLVIYNASGQAIWHTHTYGTDVNRLTMQTDGNLVLYTLSNKAPWHTHTYNREGQGVYAIIQDDGNLVLYTASNQAIWDSKGYTNKEPPTADRLKPGESIQAGDSLISSNGNYRLEMQTDGNLVIYNQNNQAIWHTHTYNTTASNLIMQLDGNLVLYSSNRVAHWHTHTQNRSGQGVNAVIQNDGNFVLYTASNEAIWDSMGQTKKDPPTPPPPKIPDTDITNYSAMVTADSVNIRSTPDSSTSSNIIGSRNRGESVVVTHRNGVWRRIVWPSGKPAYIYSRYIVKIGLPRPDSCAGRPDFTDEFIRSYYMANRDIIAKPDDRFFESLSEFNSLVATGRPLDIKNTDKTLVKWKNCGVKIFDRIVATDVPGNILFGMFGYNYFSTKLLDGAFRGVFLVGAAGGAQCIHDRKCTKDRVIERLLIRDSQDLSQLATFDPACDTYAIDVGISVAEALERRFISKPGFSDIKSELEFYSTSTVNSYLYNERNECRNGRGDAPPPGHPYDF